MNNPLLVTVVVSAFFFGACGVSETNVEEVIAEETTLTKAEAIVSNCIEAHGGKLYENAHFSFLFRKKTYEFQNDGDNYSYKRTFVDELLNEVVDVYENGAFKRMLNGELVEVKETDIEKYSEAINSVIYFATLPHKIGDKSVIKEYIGECMIKEQSYEIIKVSFNQEGGGVDFEDEYYYWINKTSMEMDYLAYLYHVNGGGVRFREGYNQRTVDGVIFQDYINYEAPIGTPLMKLPTLFEAGELIELSRIDTEQLESLK